MKLRITTALLFLLGFGINASAQAPDYDDLLIYFADGEYEKCLQKSEKYTLNDKTKKDAIPYLYLSKSNYELSKDESNADDYRKAFKDAVKFASKCIKYDTELVIWEDEVKYFKLLKSNLLEQLKNLADIGSYPKMLSPISLLQRLDKQDVGSYWLKAAVLYKNQDKSGAKLIVKEAQAKLDEVQSVDSWHPVDLESLKFGVMEYCKTVNDMGQIQKSKDLLGKVKQWLEFDEDFMAFYDQVVN